MNTERQLSPEEMHAWMRGWARMMETSFLMQLVNGRETALPFHTWKGTEFTSLADMRDVVPARFSHAPRPPRQNVSRDVVENFCANEIDARIPARA